MTTRKPLFDRGRVTDWLLDMLTTELGDPLLAGDGMAPEAGGWPLGDPGNGDFVPYLTLATGKGVPVSADPLAAAEGEDWQLAYTISYFGGTRSQTDWAADLGRAAWNSRRDARIECGSATAPNPWKAYRFAVAEMGALTRNDQVQPPYWQLVDQATLRLTRCRA